MRYIGLLRRGRRLQVTVAGVLGSLRGVHILIPLEEGDDERRLS